MRSDVWERASQRYGRTVKADPQYVAEPSGIQDLVTLVKTVPKNCTIDILGAGVSPNGLYDRSSECLLLTGKLNKALPMEAALFHKDPRLNHYWQTEAGVPIKKLFDDLDAAALALDWGGYAPQSLLGAVISSTHKSGFTRALPDFVLSLDVVLGDGSIRRIEPSQGITNPAEYGRRFPDRKLVQDDKTFYSVIVLCDAGIVYSVIIQAEPRYSLIMQRVYFRTLDEAKPRVGALLQDLCREPGQRQDKLLWQVDLWVLPGSLQTIAMIHGKIPWRKVELIDSNPLGYFLAVLREIGQGITEAALRLLAATAPELIDAALKLVFPAMSAAPTVFDWRNYGGGGIPSIEMMAVETAFPYKGDANEADFGFIDTVKALPSGVAYTAPIGIRFISSSLHSLSMFRKTGVTRFVTLEQPLSPTHRAGQTVMRRLASESGPLSPAKGGRLHWGLNNFLREEPKSMRDAYGSDIDLHLATRREITNGLPAIFKPQDVLHESKTDVGPMTIQVRMKVLQSIAGFWALPTHGTSTTRVVNELDCAIVLHSAENSFEAVSIPTRSSAPWPFLLPWVNSTEEMYRKAHRLTVGHRLFAWVFMNYRTKLPCWNSGGRFSQSIPISDLPISQGELMISGTGRIDVDPAWPADETRYYRIRERTKGEYLGIDGDEDRIRRLGWDPTEQQLFRFRKLPDQSLYQIQSKRGQNAVCRLEGREWGRYYLKLGAAGVDKYSMFRLELDPAIGSYLIHEFSAGNEVLGVGTSAEPTGYVIRWTPNDPGSQRFWLEDAGPIH